MKSKLEKISVKYYMANNRRTVMKKYILAILLMLLIPCGAMAFEDDFVLMTATATASGNAYTGAGYYYGCLVNTDGTNSVTLTVYDNTAESGTAFLLPPTVVTTSSSNYGTAISEDPPLPINTGITFTGTSSGSYTITFRYRAR